MKIGSLKCGGYLGHPLTGIPCAAARGVSPLHGQLQKQGFSGFSEKRAWFLFPTLKVNERRSDLACQIGLHVQILNILRCNFVSDREPS